MRERATHTHTHTHKAEDDEDEGEAEEAEEDEEADKEEEEEKQRASTAPDATIVVPRWSIVQASRADVIPDSPPGHACRVA